MCSRLCVGSTLNAQLGYTHSKDYINTQAKKSKAAVHGCAAVWLAKGLHFERVPEGQSKSWGAGRRGKRERERERTRWWGEKKWRKSDAHGLLPPRGRNQMFCVSPPPLCFYSLGGFLPPTNITQTLELISKLTSFAPELNRCWQAVAVTPQQFAGVPVTAFPCVQSKVTDIIVDFCRSPLSHCPFNMHHIRENNRFRRRIMAAGCCDMHSM